MENAHMQGVSIIIVPIVSLSTLHSIVVGYRRVKVQNDMSLKYIAIRSNIINYREINIQIFPD